MKKLLIILASILFLVGGFLLLGSKTYEGLQQTTIVRYEPFESNYHVLATVTAHHHFLFFEGSISELKVSEHDFVDKGDVVLTYNDITGKKKTLKSTVTGLVVSVSNGCLEIVDEDYYLEAYVPLEVFNLLKLNQKGSFELNDKYQECILTQKEYYGEIKNGMLVYKISLSLDGNALLNQKVSVMLPLESKDGLVVNKNALLMDEEGYYLLDAKYYENPVNVNSYRLNVKVLFVNDEEALIDGINIENKVVCVLDDYLRELLDVGN